MAMASLFLASALLASNAEFHIAPMQCYTNLPLRTLCHFLSPSAVTWTEMEKVDDLLPNVQQALEKRLGSAEPNLVLQFGSNDPRKVQRCVEITVQEYPHLKEVNLNCGCPAIDSGGAPTYGASLMKDPTLTASLVEACRSSCRDDMNVSVKCRIGVVDHVDDLRPSLQQEDYAYLRNYVSDISKAGANHVILHARPAILSGLSPVKNRLVPRLQHEFCERIAAEFEHLKVTSNGGITSLSQLQELQTIESIEKSRISSHMAGRWILRRPLDLLGVEQLLSQSRQDEETKETTSMVEDAYTAAKHSLENYLNYCQRNMVARDSTATTADLCLPLFLVVEQLREDYEKDNIDSLLLSYEEMESLYDLLQDGLLQLGSGGKAKSSVNFKRLSTNFKSLVGTKVVNKWKRNRAESL